MKSKIKPVVAAVLFGVVSPGFAASAQHDSLQTSVKQLQTEVAALKSQLHLAQLSPPEYTQDHTRRIVRRYQQMASLGTRTRRALRETQRRTHEEAAAAYSASPPETNKPTTNQNAVANQEANNAFVLPENNIPTMNDFYLPFDPYVPGQAFVTTGPYLGVRVQYAGTNLIVNSPSVNNDVQLLDIRKKVIQQLNEIMGEARMKPTFSHLLFSGVIESQAWYTDPQGSPSRTDIDLTNMSFDATIFGPNDWLLGLIELSYSPNQPTDSVFLSNSHYRVANSRVFVNKAFVTIGNFTQSPFYGTFGMFYVPFGTYSSVMVSGPLTRWGRTKARSILIGYQQQSTNAFYGSAYIFRGDSYSHSVPKVSNGGVNFGYKFVLNENMKANIGAGLISSIADSGVMQVGNNFAQFEQVVHRVPAYNLRGVFSFWDNIDLITEYIGASNAFNPLDMSYNNHGAKPTAYDIELNYSFPILGDKPSSIGIGYSKTSESMAMHLPLSRSFIVFNTSLRRNTLQSLELRHDRNYAASDVGSQAGNVIVASQNGRSVNTITAQFDYYF